MPHHTAPNSPRAATNQTRQLQNALSTNALCKTASAREFLTAQTLSHYLTFHKHSVPTATQALLSTLSWRSSYRPHTLADRHRASLRAEAASGKLYVLPICPSCRTAVLVLRPGLENSSDPDAKLRFITYSLERAAHATSSGRIVVIIDHRPGRLALSSMPTVALLKSILSTLQTHYPGRLVACYFVNAPIYITTTVRALRPLLEPATRNKLHFVRAGFSGEVQGIAKGLHAKCLPKEFGGEKNYQFDVDEYLPP